MRLGVLAGRMLPSGPGFHDPKYPKAMPHPTPSLHSQQEGSIQSINQSINHAAGLVVPRRRRITCENGLTRKEAVGGRANRRGRKGAHQKRGHWAWGHLTVGCFGVAGGARFTCQCLAVPLGNTNGEGKHVGVLLVHNIIESGFMCDEGHCFGTATVL